ncbi:MAG: hypothetical protein CMP11_04365 [Zetaproteobacteria bacterium]|nr:hypothetical protein [Pseudobdellovibrionaceae bacterium]
MKNNDDLLTLENEKDLILNKIVGYPKSSHELGMNAVHFNLSNTYEKKYIKNSRTVHISPFGVLFKTHDHFDLDSLLKVQVMIPEYWNIKKRLVTYQRVDNFESLAFLVRVISIDVCEDDQLYNLIAAETVNMHSDDQQALIAFLGRSAR